MTVKETIEILIIYKERLKNEYEKPGWNKWALFGTFSSLIWLLLDTIKNNEFDFKEAVLLSIIIFFLHNITNQIFSQIQKKENKHQDKYINIKKYSISIIIQLVFETLILLLIGYIIQNNINGCKNYFVQAILIIKILTYTLAIIISRTKFPFPFTLPKIKIVNSTTNYLFYVHIIMQSIAIAILIFSIKNWQSISTYKSSFLIFGLYFTLSKLIETMEKRVDIYEIDTIIDSVTFGKLKPEKALVKLNKIVNGETTSDVISYLKARIALTYNIHCFELLQIEKQILSADYNSSTVHNKKKIEKDFEKTIKRKKRAIVSLETYSYMLTIFTMKKAEHDQITKQLIACEQKLSLRTINIQNRISTTHKCL